MTNADLLARMHKVELVLVTDKMVEGTGHKILRLPPYHSHWNPIELVWGITKRYYDSHISEGTNIKKQG